MSCLDTSTKTIDFGILIDRCIPTSRTTLLASKSMFTKLANTCNLTEKLGYCDVKKYKKKVGGAELLVCDYANTKDKESGRIMLVYQKLNNRDALSLLSSVV